MAAHSTGDVESRHLGRTQERTPIRSHRITSGPLAQDAHGGERGNQPDHAARHVGDECVGDVRVDARIGWFRGITSQELPIGVFLQEITPVTSVVNEHGVEDFLDSFRDKRLMPFGKYGKLQPYHFAYAGAVRPGSVYDSGRMVVVTP